MESPPPPTRAPAPAPLGARAGRRRRWPRFRARVRQIGRRILLLLGPITLVALAIWGVGQATSAAISTELFYLTIVSLFAMGTTVILAPAATGAGLPIPLTGKTFELHLGTWEIALWLIFLNATAAFFYAYNMDLLERIPVVGPYLQRVRHNASKTLERHRWIRHLAGLGVVLFVLSPLPGSGQLGGCFIGRVIGLTKRTIFLVVTLAGTLVAVGYALFGQYIKGLLDEIEADPWIRVAGAAALLVIVFFVIKLFRYLGRVDAETGTGAPPPRG